MLETNFFKAKFTVQGAFTTQGILEGRTKKKKNHEKFLIFFFKFSNGMQNTLTLLIQLQFMPSAWIEV